MSHKTRSNSKSSLTKSTRWTLGKRLSKFFSKLLWHLNPTVPTCGTRDSRRMKLHTRRATNRSHHYEPMGSTGKGHYQIRYSPRYRTCSVRQRQPTLTSIAEENEMDIVNCK